MSTPAKPQKFDIVIIGGGPAGYVAAIKGRLAGFKVVVLEKERVGGACINKGCIPTKALWGTAVHLKRLKDSPEHGISIGKVEFDFKTAMRRQYSISDQMVTAIQNRMDRLNITTLFGEAQPIGRTKSGRFFKVPVKKGNGQTVDVTGKFVLIATGSHPAESAPLIPDHKKVITTDDIVKLEKLPKRLVIAGGGVVACEFASILTQFGVKIDLLEHSRQVLSSMDPEVVGILNDVFARDGITVHTHTKTTSIDTSGKGVKVHVTSNGKPKVIESDMMLLAIGRRPNSDGLGLKELGVQLTERGHVVVNEKLETHCKGIFAAGDVIGGQMLAHKAWYDADLAVRAMAGEEVRTNYETVPGAIFTVPEMASVGISHEQAQKLKKQVSIGKFYYKENSQAMCVGKTIGMVKAVIDRNTGRVLGCSMIGHDSSNLISEVALAMSAGLNVTAITNTIHPHPTLSEMLLESFLDTQGRSIHKF